METVGPVPVAAVSAGAVGGVAGEPVGVGGFGGGVLRGGGTAVGFLGVGGRGPGGVLVDLAVIAAGAVLPVVQSMGALALVQHEATVLRVMLVVCLVVGIVDVVVPAGALSVVRER